MEKETAMGNTLAQVKENIWKRIEEAMVEICPYIQIIFEQKELIEISSEAIEKIKVRLGDKPSEATELLKFLNSKNKQELKELDIEDITKTILEVKKVMTKRNLIRQLEEKCQVLDIGVQRFFNKMEALYKKGLHSLLVINEKLSTRSDYSHKLLTKAKDASKFTGGRIKMTGKSFLEALAYDLEIQYQIKHIFISKPTFSKYTEVDEVYRKLCKTSIPSEQGWDELCDLLE